MEKAQEFYVISVWHTLRENPYILLWKPNDRGHTFRTSTAGKYAADEIARCPSYYHAGYNNIAVPVEVLDKMTVMTTPADCLDGPDGPAVRNTPENWRKILAALTMPPQQQPKPHALFFGKNSPDRQAA